VCEHKRTTTQSRFCFEEAKQEFETKGFRGATAKPACFDKTKQAAAAPASDSSSKRVTDCLQLVKKVRDPYAPKRVALPPSHLLALTTYIK
jgi:hypothetical protein